MRLAPARRLPRYIVKTIDYALPISLMAAQQPPTYWFPAKRYGWGWGFPSAWQGWVVLLAYAALIVSGWWLLPPQLHPVLFMCFTAAITALLIAVCWVKGERPRWRWGSRR